MQFLNPIWLWGLTGLAIPIGIHLLSRKEGTIIKLGSVRYLENTPTKRLKDIRLNEHLLLASRCLFIIILVIFLSDLQINTAVEKEKWLLIEKGLSNDPEFVSLIDSLKKHDFELKSLSPGFPDLKDSLSESKKVNYWDLLDELKTKPVEQAVVLAYNYASVFKGKRQPLPEHVQWITKNPKVEKFVLRSIQVSKDSIMSRRGESNSEKTSFFSERVAMNSFQSSINKSDSSSIEPPTTISISIFSDSTFEYDARIMRAALQAVDEMHPDRFDVRSFAREKYSPTLKCNWVIFLSNNLPAEMHHSSIRFKKAADLNQPLLYEVENKDTRSAWMLTQRLTEEVALQNNLTVQLATILFANDTYTRRAEQFDRRVLPEQITWSMRDQHLNEVHADAKTTSTEKYLMLFLLLALLVERWLSFKRKQ